MLTEYAEVITRYLRDDERLVLSEDKEVPLVIEAKEARDLQFLQQFLCTNSKQLLADLASHGALLLRGFTIHSEQDFEAAILSLPEFRGISEAFMSEEGRIHVAPLKYVLHTNAVYKTGGTLYLGGFHSENYYTPDVPSYISFCCLKPSLLGGETGLVNMEKIYQKLDPVLQEKLEKNSFFVTKWLISEVMERYKLTAEEVEKIATRFGLPIVGEGHDKFIFLYKPSVFEHPITRKKSLQINLFELIPLNKAMRRYFINDYPGKTWFWHRLVWRLPDVVLKLLEFFYVMFASFFYSPKDSLNILRTKIRTYKASKKLNLPQFVKVGNCFEDKDIKKLAQLIRTHYSSCLWQKGDILLVDNRKLMHAGMPGAGPRLVRALIGNPLEMNYDAEAPGSIECKERDSETVGFYMTSCKVDDLIRVD